MCQNHVKAGRCPLRLEALEDRLALSRAGLTAALITPPAGTVTVTAATPQLATATPQLESATPQLATPQLATPQLAVGTGEGALLADAALTAWRPEDGWSWS
jgi:hypothetical protein